MWGCNSCNSNGTKAPQSTEGEAKVANSAADPRGLRRNPVAEQRIKREGLDVIRADSIEDPTLDPYPEGEHENDGGTHAEAPPKPSAPKGGSKSFSVGQPNAGWLVNGRKLARESRNHRVLPHTYRRGWYYGGTELLDALMRAANRVARKHPSSVMRVGSLSREGGGKVYPPHASHQSGRDADIGLYCTDLDGQPVDPPGFPRFDGRLGDTVDSTGRYLFDLPRNWAFVESLISDENARVQWIFLDTPLKWLLLDYAVRVGAKDSIIDKAEKVVVRPNNSSAHDNHFHIRIFCTQRDMDWGCKDYGPEWSWVKDERERYDKSIENQVERIMNGKGDFDPIGAETPEATKPGTQTPPTPSKVPRYERQDKDDDIQIEL